MQKKIQWDMLPTIFALAWPTMFEQLMQTAVQYIDTAMVGALGTHATAAVGATTTINWLINGSIAALGVGFLAYIAQACGAGLQERVSRAVAQAVLTTLVVGALFTALTLGLSGVIPVWMQVDESIRETASQYFFVLYLPMLPRTATLMFGTILRAAGDSKTPMWVGVMMNVVNIILNCLFIYPTRTVTWFSRSVTLPGLGWGVQGAAAASAVAFTLGGLVITIALWRHPVVSPKGVSMRPDWQVLKPCLRVALPNMLQRFATSLGYVVSAAMINSLGEVATAAHTIANTVESAFYIPGFGMQTAAATLAGNAVGAGDKERLHNFKVVILVMETGMMVVSAGLLFLFAPPMMGIFSDSPEVILLGVTLLRMVAVSEPFYGISIILEGMLQGVGNTVIPFALNIAGMWGIRIVGTYLCSQVLGLGLVEIWVCMILHNMMLFAAFSLYHRFGCWNPLLKKKNALV